MIKAILLDFNGVIINDEPIQMKAYQDILAKENIALSEADYYSCLGMDDATFIREAYKRAGREPETNKVLEIALAKTERWRELVANSVPLFDGMENFIRKMANEFTLGLVSMARREEIDIVLAATDLAGFFAAIVSAENVSACKPDPECYRQGFAMLDSYRTARGHLPMTHNECLVIEDSPPGIKAARAADLPTLGVLNTVSEAEMRAAGADWIAADLNDWMPDSVRRVYA